LKKRTLGGSLASPLQAKKAKKGLDTVPTSPGSHVDAPPLEDEKDIGTRPIFQAYFFFSYRLAHLAVGESFEGKTTTSNHHCFMRMKPIQNGK